MRPFFLIGHASTDRRGEQIARRSAAEARSVQSKFPTDGLEFRRLDQPGMGDRDGM
jgi:hypothetical protein